MPWTPGRDKKMIMLYGGLFLGACVIVALLSLFLPNPLTQDLSLRFQPPALPYFLGADHLGRDLSARLYYGFLNSAGLISLTMLTTLVIAIPTGLVAVHSRGAETVLEVVAGAVWSIPTFIIALIVFIGYKGDLIAVKFALLGMFNWVPIFRAVRDTAKQVEPSYYITFVRAMGMKESQVYWSQILPNVLPVVFPTILLNLISLFEAEFVLSFLGLSYPDPAPTLGGMLKQGTDYGNLTMILLPSILLAVVVFCIITVYQRMSVRGHGL